MNVVPHRSLHHLLAFDAAHDTLRRVAGQNEIARFDLLNRLERTVLCNITVLYEVSSRLEQHTGWM